MNTTQDAGITGQASIALRNVKDEEILLQPFAILPLQDSSGNDVNELLKAKNKERELQYEKIAGKPFDGASNWTGKFNGLSSLIKTPFQIWFISGATVTL